MTAQHDAMQGVVEIYRYFRMNQGVSQTEQTQCKAGRSTIQTLNVMDHRVMKQQTHCKDWRPIIQALFPDPREVPVCSNQHLGTHGRLTIIKVHCHTICILLIACYLYL